MDYPYFIYPAVMKLRKGVDDPEEAMRLRRFVGANVGHIPSLRLILGLDPEEFARFYPDLLPPDLTTEDTIDSFLSRFGNADLPTPRAAAEIPEASETIAEDEDFSEEISVGSNSDSTSSLLDNFLSAHPDKTPPSASCLSEHMIGEKEKTAPASGHTGDIMQEEKDIPHKKSALSDGETPVSERQARELIKNHHYQQALEIIQRLSLNNPEKSVYFADQIRFLKKIIFLQANNN